MRASVGPIILMLVAGSTGCRREIGEAPYDPAAPASVEFTKEGSVYTTRYFNESGKLVGDLSVSATAVRSHLIDPITGEQGPEYRLAAYFGAEPAPLIKLLGPSPDEPEFTLTESQHHRMMMMLGTQQLLKTNGVRDPEVESALYWAARYYVHDDDLVVAVIDPVTGNSTKPAPKPQDPDAGIPDLVEPKCGEASYPFPKEGWKNPAPPEGCDETKAGPAKTIGGTADEIDITVGTLFSLKSKIGEIVANARCCPTGTVDNHMHVPQLVKNDIVCKLTVDPWNKGNPQSTGKQLKGADVTISENLGGCFSAPDGDKPDVSTAFDLELRIGTAFRIAAKGGVEKGDWSQYAAAGMAGDYIFCYKPDPANPTDPTKMWTLEKQSMGKVSRMR